MIYVLQPNVHILVIFYFFFFFFLSPFFFLPSFQLVTLPDVGFGIKLAEVVPWSAAWRCGELREGDVVITVDGETALFLSVEDVIEYLSEDITSVEIVVVSLTRIATIMLTNNPFSCTMVRVSPSPPACAHVCTTATPQNVYTY